METLKQYCPKCHLIVAPFERGRQQREDGVYHESCARTLQEKVKYLCPHCHKQARVVGENSVSYDLKCDDEGLEFSIYKRGGGVSIAYGSLHIVNSRRQAHAHQSR
jgi:Zn finger protein HypA/HybF involved in hydrogenase expression